MASKAQKKKAKKSFASQRVEQSKMETLERYEVKEENNLDFPRIIDIMFDDNRILDGENILDDGYPTYWNRIYLFNGKPIKSHIYGTVRDLKRSLFKEYKIDTIEIRNCLIGDRLKLKRQEMIKKEEASFKELLADLDWASRDPRTDEQFERDLDLM